jgi:hypothetical protein
MYPVEYFEGATYGLRYEDDIRIRMFAQGFSSLGYFFGINKLISQKKPIYLLLIILNFSVILLMGFRTMSVMLIFCTFILVVRLTGFNKNLVTYTALISILIFFLSQSPLFSNVIERMFERNETQNFSDKDYIRIQQWDYYTQQHFKNPVEYFFGSGLPFLGSGDYGNYMENLFKVQLNYADLGLLSLSWMVGVIPVFAMLLYSIKAIKSRVDKKYYYVGCWFLYMLSISITTFEFTRYGNFIVQALGLYIVEKAIVTSSTK